MRFILTVCFIFVGSILSAQSSFKVKILDDPSYSECAKAIEKGVVVKIDENGTHVFFYKDRLYTIMAGISYFECYASEIEK